MVRILTTGDLHIGRKYTNQSDEISQRYSKARIEALHNVLKAAEDQECDYIVIAGDLFDTRYVSVELIKQVCGILGTSICPVIVLPGNHDFYEDSNDKLWGKFREHAAANTTVLTENSPAVMGKIKFYPCVCNDKHSEENRLGWMAKNKDREAGYLHIGLAHGALEGLSYDNEKRYYYMTRAELEGCGMDLWLIGHTHIPYPEGDVITGEKIFNPGTHQQTDISDNSEGSVFVISIDDDKQVTARKIPTGVLRFCKLSLDLRHGQSLKEEIHKLTCDLDGESTSVRMRISGIALAEDYDRRGEIYREFEDRFVKFEPHDMDLQKEITQDMIDTETLEGSVENKLLKMYVKEPEILNLAYELVRQCGEGK
ncbi:MAG: DNA repair exonuclease [Hungatella sp.]|nr:DNA repair exonuclease [Hungatella sp.]